MWFHPLLLALGVWILPYHVKGYDVPTNFGCQNSMISDDWRRYVLQYHNRKRLQLATGNVKTDNNNKVAPMAKNMNELLWDCNIEKYATDNLCTSGNIAAPYAAVTENFKNKKSCNVTVEAKTLLDSWWSQSNAIDLTANQNYNAAADKFAQMADATAKAFACTYGSCGSGLTLLCVYDKKLAGNDQIYEEAADLTEVCTNCATQILPPDKKCIAQLCQEEYTSPGDIPARTCGDGMTNAMGSIAEDMHNYYRRLVATGWGKDKTDGYAPRAKTMLSLKYACDVPGGSTIATDTKTLASTCPSAAPTATAGYSLNHYYKNSYTISEEDLLEQAITKWANEAAEVGVGKENLYHPDKGFNEYANMMRDTATEVTCSVAVCKNTGNSAVICQYNQPSLFDGDPIYTVGKPCTGCPTGTSCDNNLGGGLCATTP